MNAASLMIVMVFMMVLTAAYAVPISDNDQVCIGNFKVLLGKNFKMPADVATFLASLTVDWDELFREDSIGEEIFLAAAKKTGRPNKGCEEVQKFAELASNGLACMEELDFDDEDMHKLLIGDELISEYWRANIACKASE